MFEIFVLTISIIFILNMLFIGTEKNNKAKEEARDLIVMNDIEQDLKGKIVTDYTILLNNVYVHDIYVVDEIRTIFSQYARSHTSETYQEWVSGSMTEENINTIINNANTNMDTYIASYYNLVYGEEETYTADYIKAKNIYNIAKDSITIDNILDELKNNLLSATWYSGIEKYVHENRISELSNIAKSSIITYSMTEYVKDDFKKEYVNALCNYQLTLNDYNALNIDVDYLEDLTRSTLGQYDGKIETKLQGVSVSSYTSYNAYYINLLGLRHETSLEIYNETLLTATKKAQLKDVFYSDEYEVTVNVLYFLVSLVLELGFAAILLIDFIKDNNKENENTNTLFMLASYLAMYLIIFVVSSIGHALSHHTFSDITYFSLLVKGSIVFVIVSLISVGVYHLVLRLKEKRK